MISQDNLGKRDYQITMNYKIPPEETEKYG